MTLYFPLNVLIGVFGAGGNQRFIDVKKFKDRLMKQCEANQLRDFESS
jgi:hypothetical protein